METCTCIRSAQAHAAHSTHRYPTASSAQWQHTPHTATHTSIHRAVLVCMHRMLMMVRAWYEHGMTWMQHGNTWHVDGKNRPEACDVDKPNTHKRNKRKICHHTNIHAMHHILVHVGCHVWRHSCPQWMFATSAHNTRRVLLSGFDGKL